MLNRIIKISFSILGAVTGFTVLRTIFIINNLKFDDNVRIAFFVLVSLVSGAIFYFVSSKIIEYVGAIIDKVENSIQKITPFEMLVCSIGLIIGLVVANLICIPILKIQIIGLPFSIIINILFGILGVILPFIKRNDGLIDIVKDSRLSDGKYTNRVISKILDTSTIIDGRILDICNTGFLDGEIIIPSYVLEELRHIADSADSMKRARGRRGLDVLNLLQKDGNYKVKIEDFDFPENIEVDERLLKTTQKLKGNLVTTDYNLSKVAALRNIKVLNINDLANAVKPIALPGEEMSVQIVKEGKESGQGIAFLDDGTMIVVEGGKKYLGDTLPVMVTSVLQTSAGRMVFAKSMKNCS